MSAGRTDRIVTLHGALVQHGKSNDRVYLMRLEPAGLPDLIPALDALALRHGYSKIFAKAPASALPAFRREGYREEARVPRYFSGKRDGVFLGKYLDPDRAVPRRNARRREALAAALAGAASAADRPVKRLPSTLTWSEAGSADAEPLARLFAAVFETYPFPVHDPAFLRRSMKEHAVYGCLRHRGEIVAVSSAEMDAPARAAEMSDFAIAPAWRGRGLARILLHRMEQAIAGQGVRTAFTIARAVSAPMNRTFASQGYAFGGTLINNTQICGRLESMNVWHKPLKANGA